MDEEAMSPSPRATTATCAGIHWEAHGRLLTALLVALNIFLVLLVYVYFWRFFSRSRGGGAEDDDDAAAEGASLVASSPPASPRAGDRREVQLAITTLPVFVHSSSPGGGATGGGRVPDLYRGVRGRRRGPPAAAVRPPLPRALRRHVVPLPHHLPALPHHRHRRCHAAGAGANCCQPTTASASYGYE